MHPYIHSSIIYNCQDMEVPINRWMDKEYVVYMQWNIQFSSVTQSSPTLCVSMDCGTPGFPVHHQLTELTQTEQRKGY